MASEAELQRIMDELAQRCDVAAPRVTVVGRVGHRRRGGRLGHNGTAVTITRDHDPTVEVAEPAAQELSRPALTHLLGHELHHVMTYRAGKAHRLRRAWVFTIIGCGAVALPAIVLSNPWWPRPVQDIAYVLVLASLTAAVLTTAVGQAFVRRHELAADRFGVRLAGSIDGAEELTSFYEADQFPTSAPRFTRWLSDHPPAARRRAAMIAALDDADRS